MRQFAPWILVAVALAAIFPAVKIQERKKASDDAGQVQAKEDEEKPEEAEIPEPANPCKPEKEGDLEFPWCEPLRVLRDFYGLQTTREESQDFAKIISAASAENSGYRLKFLVALVPDPIESQSPLGLDIALDAIQKGFAEEGFLFDRYWLPWAGEAGKKDHLYRTSPGILLFRRDGGDARCLAVVFLVGESPKAGIHKRAFRQAMDIAKQLRGAAEDARVAILGPTFSGSIDSLIVALREWRLEGNGTLLRIASGSATAAGLKDKFEKLKTELAVPGSYGELGFCRTLVPDDLLLEKAFGFLEESMKWDLRRAAFLAESDTGYGQDSSDISQKIVKVRFPSGISDLRNAWKRREQEQGAGERDVKVGETRISTSREALDLNLQDRDRALDTIPRFSPLSTLSRDQELAGLLETISRDDIRYVGVLATDLKDRIFVMEKVRHFSPDTILFTFNNDVLLGHVEYSDVMDGVLVISSSPLFTEGASWLPRSHWGGSRERRQFLGEFQQGTFQAVRYLLDGEVRSTPQVWISVVGNGSLWPMAQIPLGSSKERSGLCRSVPQQQLASAPPRRLSEEEGGLAGKANLQVIFFAVGLCLASLGLRRAGLIAESRGSDVRPVQRPASRLLMTSGAAILALASAVLLVVAAIPEWAWYLSGDWVPASWKGIRAMFLLALVLVYVYLCYQIAMSAGAAERGRLALFLWGFGIALAPYLLVWLVFTLWMPNKEIEFFQLRARAYSSGLSPIVSLTLLGGAGLVWVLCELRRRVLFERQNTFGFALDVLCSSERSLQGCSKRLKNVSGLLRKVFPRGESPGERPWILPLSVFLPFVVMLWGTLQPITDTKNYGRLFLVLVVVTASLAALSFYRFVRVWWNLRRILLRLDHISPGLAKTFEALAPQIGWKPMRSFGFRIPPFKMLILSAEKLRTLLQARPMIWVSTAELDDLIRKTFDSEGKDMQTSELRHRRKLEDLFNRACGELGGPGSIWRSASREFLAVRVAAYLRYVFAQLRNCLLGALGTGLLLLLAVSAYAFEPKQFVSFGVWMGLAIAATLTLWIFIQMDRNPTLSRIGGTKEGEVTFDKTFYTNLLLYGGVPALGVIATQFPDVGHVLGQLVDPLLRVTGGG